MFDGRPFAPLAGVSLPVVAQAGRGRFEDALLFTHRGLSGPAVLQISSYWREGEALRLALLPPGAAQAHLRAMRAAAPKRTLPAALSDLLPARLAARLCPDPAPLGATGNATLAALDRRLSAWELRPTGTEGYRTAEVTLGGVATGGLSPRTMEAGTVPGLFVVGEAVDVTGWLGGYNFQWAWASADAAARAIRARGGAS